MVSVLVFSGFLIADTVDDPFSDVEKLFSSSDRINKYTELLKTPEYSAHSYYMRAKEHMEVSNIPNALADLAQAEILGYDLCSLKKMSARVALKARNYHQAEKFLRDASMLCPGDVQLNRIRALMKFQQGFPKEALEYLEDVTETNFGGIIIHKDMAALYGLIGEHKKAEKLYRSILSYIGQESWLECGYAWALYNQEQYAKSASQFSRVIKREPFFVDAHVGLAFALTKMKKRSKAIASIERAIEIDPRYDIFQKAVYEGEDNLGGGFNLYRYSGSIDEKDDLLETYLFDYSGYIQQVKSRTNLAKLYYYRAILLDRLARPKQALYDFYAADYFDPKNITYLYKILAFETDQKLLFRAEKRILELMSVQGTNDFLLNYQGYILLQKEDVEGALLSYNRAIMLNQTNSEYFANRAQVFVSLSKYSEAISDYQKAVSLDPENYFLHAMVSYCNRLMGRLPATVSNAEHCFRNQYKVGWLLQHAAKAYLEMRDFTNALKCCTNAVAMSMNRNYCELIQIEALARMGRLSDARELGNRIFHTYQVINSGNAKISMAYLYLGIGMAHDAERLLTSMVSNKEVDYKTEAFVYQVRAKANCILRRIHMASNDIEISLLKNPYSEEAMLLKGQIMMALQHDQDALDILRRDFWGKNPEVVGEAWAEKSRLLHRMGFHDGSKHIFHLPHLSELQKPFGPCANFLTHMFRGEMNRVEDDLWEMRQMNPRFPRVLVQEGIFVWYKYQDKNRAISLLAEGLEAGYPVWHLTNSNDEGYFLKGLNTTPEFKELVRKYSIQRP